MDVGTAASGGLERGLLLIDWLAMARSRPKVDPIFVLSHRRRYATRTAGRDERVGRPSGATALWPQRGPVLREDGHNGIEYGIMAGMPKFVFERASPADAGKARGLGRCRNGALEPFPSTTNTRSTSPTSPRFGGAGGASLRHGSSI